MCEGLLDCADAKPDGFRGAPYVQAVELANAQWQVGIVLDQRQARLDAQTAADDALAADMAPLAPDRAPSPPDAPDSEAHTGIVAHRIPDYLRDHPDPAARRYWRRAYRTANAFKQRHLHDPYVHPFPSLTEGAAHDHR
jgi:hypothetical protein